VTRILAIGQIGSKQNFREILFLKGCKNSLRGVSRMSKLFAASSRVQSRLLARDAPLRCDLIGENCECTTTPVWFLLSDTAAAQLLANSCLPLRFAWTTGRRSARGISVRLTSCSRSPALADLTTQRRRSSGQGRLIFTPSCLNVKFALAVAVEPLCERADKRDAGLNIFFASLEEVRGHNCLLASEIAK
jgi:hypothetical protein